ncbi:MAG: hypothetical protein KDA84_14965 [Planctomycetaceae bacterium]|nr:hypothetical protein [Planctomycetaceae bacterium]
MATDLIATEKNREKYIMLGQVVVSWEALRIPYNCLILILFTFFQQFGVFLDVTTFFLLNACFLFGPLVDGYLSWFGLRHNALTAFLFSGGSILTILIFLEMAGFPGK